MGWEGGVADQVCMAVLLSYMMLPHSCPRDRTVYECEDECLCICKQAVRTLCVCFVYIYVRKCAVHVCIHVWVYMSWKACVFCCCADFPMRITWNIKPRGGRLAVAIVIVIK